MKQNASAILLIFVVLWLGLAAAGRGATTATLASIHQAIADEDSQNRIGDGDRLHLERMLVLAVDKDAAGLVRYGKKCNAEKVSRLRSCLSWCLYLADPAKYASQYVEMFPIDWTAPDGAYYMVYNEFGWCQYAQEGLLLDPFACLGRIALTGDKKAIEKLLLVFSGNGAEDTLTIEEYRYRTIQKWPKETIHIAAELSDKGRDVDPLGDPMSYSQAEFDGLKEKVRPLLSDASPTEKGIIEGILDFYVQDVPGPQLDDVPGFTPPPYKLPLTDGQKWCLGEMLKCADAQDEAGLAKFWNGLDELWQKNRVLILAHQWYLYTIAPEKWRDAFVEKFPTDPGGISDYYRASHACCPKASAGSAMADLGKIAEGGDTRAIERLVAGRCFGPPGWDELNKTLIAVLERQPAKTVRAMAAVPEGCAYASPNSVYRTVGGKRLIALREQLQELEPGATEREKRVLRGFMTFSTDHLVNLAPDEVVKPLAPKP